MSIDVQALLSAQIRYYDDRAREFDDCYYRRGRHDMGPEFNRRWFREIRILEAVVRAFPISGRVLELASGTGLWTRWLVPKVDRLVAVDASEKMNGLNRQRIGDSRVEYVQADVFEWEPTSEERFDAIFVGFFLSHIPPEGIGRFWERLAAWLAPGGLVAFCDDRDGPDRPYSGDTVPDGPAYAHRRQLSGGREYTIVKVFYSPEELRKLLERRGWNAEIHGTGEHFLYGTATPVGP